MKFASHAGELVRCSLHDRIVPECWINLDGTHIPKRFCTCYLSNEDWSCPVDLHAQEWRNANPEHGKPWLKKDETTMPQNPSQECQDCNGGGVVGTPHLFQAPKYSECPTCHGEGKVTIQKARKQGWKIKHKPRVAPPATAPLFEEETA